MTAGHWDRVYSTREATGLGWYEPIPATLDAVVETAGDTGCSIIDVGAGASTLVDHLLDRGFGDITLLDLSGEALEVTRKRLGARAVGVDYVLGDIGSFVPARQWDLWHDRATFHFLTEPAARSAYKSVLAEGLAAGGRAVIAAFAEDGPEQCAGLPVVRYDEDALAAEFSDQLACIECVTHRPGAGDTDGRPYVICRFERIEAWVGGSTSDRPR